MHKLFVAALTVVALVGGVVTSSQADVLAEGGMRVYIDPHTGQLTKPPADAAPAEAVRTGADALSTSDVGLVEKPSPMPGGGTMIDLQGRFHTPLAVTVRPDGTLVIQHLHAPAGSGAER